MDVRQKKQLELVDSFKAVFLSDEGQIVLDHLTKINRVYDYVWHEDPRMMALQEGRRCVVLDILNYLDIDPKILRQKIKDQQKLQESDDVF